jgi:hypothetical protein
LGALQLYLYRNANTEPICQPEFRTFPYCPSCLTYDALNVSDRGAIAAPPAAPVQNLFPDWGRLCLTRAATRGGSRAGCCSGGGGGDERRRSASPEKPLVSNYIWGNYEERGDLCCRRLSSCYFKQNVLKLVFVNLLSQ